MNITNAGRPVTKTVTIPWGDGQEVPPEHLETEANVRACDRVTRDSAVQHLVHQDKRTREWGPDLDPSPNRSLRRTPSRGRPREVRYLAEAVTNAMPQDPAIEPVPTNWVHKNNRGYIEESLWIDGEIQTYYYENPGKEIIDFKVNDNNTLTYTSTTYE